jgi:hypothetical protein
MKALSIMQPWAWLIVNGHKDIENRTWQPHNYGLKFRGKVLIHAGKNVDGGKREYPDFCEDMLEDFGIKLPAFADLQLGGIVGMAEIIDCVTESKSRWFCGKYGFVIGRARTLPFMPCKGQLGFFDVQYDMKLLEAA